ncbi:hypothetical protein [Nonomuraea angiospora]
MIRLLHWLRHRWVTVEQIGRVITQRCWCGKTRTRITKHRPDQEAP